MHDMRITYNESYAGTSSGGLFSMFPEDQIALLNIVSLGCIDGVEKEHMTRLEEVSMPSLKFLGKNPMER